jgi:hypothetical protein
VVGKLRLQGIAKGWRGLQGFHCSGCGRNIVVGRAVHEVGRGVNGVGRGVHEVGRGVNGVGRGVNGVGRGVNGVGRGVNVAFTIRSIRTHRLLLLPCVLRLARSSSRASTASLRALCLSRTARRRYPLYSLMRASAGWGGSNSYGEKSVTQTGVSVVIHAD